MTETALRVASANRNADLLHIRARVRPIRNLPSLA